MSDEKLREAFESWASGPPHELSVERVPNDPDKHDWPGSYRLVEVDLCWQAWKACAEKCEVEDDQPITAEWMMTPPNAKPCGRGGVELYLKPGWRVSWFDGEVQIEYFVKNMFSQSLTLKGVRSTSDMLTLIRLIEGGDE